ncbi:MAG: post-transcriptional regulator [Aerococcus sp.]|nr:post-transcriptional regulator [Aerococcus sp.]
MTLTKWQTLLLWPTFHEKAKSFHQAGYEAIQWQEIKAYFEKFKWKHRTPESMRQMRQSIQALTVNQYFDYKQLEASALDVPKLEDIDWDKLLK